MRDQLDKGERPTDGKKVVKAQDVVRMYENIIQSLGEIPSLAGLEEDEDISSGVEAEIVFYKAFRSYYIALAFIINQKWAEAMAIFQRSLQYVAQVIYFLKLNDFTTLTLQEAASGMHPKWQGGADSARPYKTSLEAILTQFFDIILIWGQK